MMMHPIGQTIRACRLGFHLLPGSGGYLQVSGPDEANNWVFEFEPVPFLRANRQPQVEYRFWWEDQHFVHSIPQLRAIRLVKQAFTLRLPDSLETDA